MYPPIDVCVDARAVFDALAASYVCDPQGSSLKLHLISVRDRLAQAIIRFLYWVDTRDMLADGLTKGGIDRTLLHNISQLCKYECKHEALRHPKPGTNKLGGSSQPQTTKQPFDKHRMHRTKVKPILSAHFTDGEFLIRLEDE